MTADNFTSTTVWTTWLF